jgi:hypothetical protein
MDHQSKRVSAIYCLIQGMKSLRSSLLVSLIFTLVLSAVGQFPTLIERLKGLHYYTATASAWGFMTSILFWLTQTLILVGVSQLVWGSQIQQSSGWVQLFPPKKVRPQILFWSAAFTVMIFVVLTGTELFVKSFLNTDGYTPVPALPLLFYFLAFVPLMMVERQLPMLIAIRQSFGSIRVNFLLLVRLALTAEAVLLTFGVFVPQRPESIVADQVRWLICTVPVWMINSAMMASAYVQVYGLSPSGTMNSNSDHA